MTVEVGLLLEQCLAPVPGGTGRYSRELATALARTATLGDRVTGWTAWHRDVGQARVAGVSGPRRLPLPRRPLVAAWERGVGPRMAADVVHAPTPLAPPRGGTPLVVTVHDAVPWTHPDTLTHRGGAWHRRVVSRAAAKADLIVVPTQSVARELARHVDLPRLVVIGEGVSSDLCLPPDAPARAAALNLPANYLLTVGTLEPRKGLDLLLDALTQAQAPDLPLLVAGQPGWRGVDLAAEAEQRGLGSRVRALGLVSDGDLAVLFRRATAVVAPSRAEGFGLPVLEAMAAGTPAVTSADPALVEVGGGATLVAEPGADGLAAALRRVVEDEELRAQLSRAGRQRAELFSWDAAARALWEAYRALLTA